MKEFSLVERQEKVCCHLVYDSCVPFWPKIEGRVLDWLVFLVPRQWGIQIPLGLIRESECMTRECACFLAMISSCSPPSLFPHPQPPKHLAAPSASPSPPPNARRRQTSTRLFTSSECQQAPPSPSPPNARRRKAFLPLLSSHPFPKCFAVASVPLLFLPLHKSLFQRKAFELMSH
jgi:hypothetical protein